MTAGAAVGAAGLGPAAREALGAVVALRRGAPAWLVGGALRELLAGGAPEDVDLAVPHGALDLGRALAARVGGTFVLLDEARGAARVVGRVQVDVMDLRGPTLEDDLRGRDFTVNALAAPLEALVREGRAAVADPTGGVADLRARAVRLAGPGALVDDPVRILRGVRLALRPGWTMSPGVEAAARAAAPGLSAVAGERVRDELVALLDDREAGRGLRLLDGLGAMAILLPESLPMRTTSQPLPHRFDVWEHSLRTVEAADALVARAAGLEPGGGEIAAHLAERLGAGMTRAGGLKLAALLHDVAKPETRAEIDGRVRFLGHEVRGAARAAAVASRLRLSRRASAAIERLVRHHLRPMHLAQAGTLTRRARHRFFRDLGDEARDLLLLATADAAGLGGDSPFAIWAGPGGSVVRALMEGVEAERAAEAAPPLLGGEDVMQAFGLAPGPEVGRLLALAREAQALGLVSTRAEALARVERSLDRTRGHP